MAHGSSIVDILRGRQSAMRRELDRRGISMKVVSLDSGVPYSSLLSYFPDELASRDAAVMPVTVQYQLCSAIPEDVLSLLLPDGRRIVRVPEDVDHDEISEVVQDYLRTKEQAHRPESPEGRDIAPCEDNVLRGKFAAVKAA